MKANRIRFSRTRMRLSEREFLREEEEFNYLRFCIEKDLEGYSEEEIEKMYADDNLRFIEDTGTSLN